MLKKEECTKARSEITAICVLEDDKFVFSTKIHGAKIVSLTRCSTLKHLSIELLCYKTTAVAFSETSELMAIANANIIYIVSTANKALLQTIKTNDGIIEIISFVPNSRYVITGTNHGRVMQYRYDGRAQLSRLCSFGHIHLENRSKSRIKNNYVSAFAFHDKFFASSGYGGVITILKMNSYTNRYIIDSSKVRINALCFLDNNKIVSGNIDGLIQIHSLKKYQAVKNIDTPFRKIKNIIVMPNRNFIMVSAEDKNLIVIDTRIAKIVTTSYLNFKDNVSHISLSGDDNLLVVLQSKQIFKVELPTAKQLKSYILHNEIDKAYELIEKDPMLKGTREHKRVEVMYENMYMKAITALTHTNTQEARKLMKMFSDIPSKKDDVNSIFKAFEYFPRFKTLFLEKRYALAYAMAEKHPALKHTRQFKKMEEAFKEAFSFAQKQILIGREDVAKEVLSVYATTVSKKPILNLILKQNKDFLKFLKVIQDKDYVSMDALIKKNPSFSEIPTFVALKDSAQTSLDEIENLIDKGEVGDAIEHIKLLLNTPNIKSELQALYKECKLIQKLQEAYAKDDFILCYEILDTSKFIDSLELVKMLEAHWSKLMNECEIFALKGDIKSIKKILGELIRVKTRVDKIGDLLRLSFQVKIKVLMSKQHLKSAENIIYSYIDIFGADAEIRLIMCMYEKLSSNKLAITLPQEQNVTRDAWLNSSLIMD